MKVYSHSYLEHVVRTQGELFDDFARGHPECDTDDFIAAYMRSRTRSDIDEGQAYVCTMNAHELMDRFVLVDRYAPRSGVSMKGFKPDWIGRFYARYQWQEGVTSAETLADVPLAFLKVAYHGLHDLDLDLAVAKVAAGSRISSNASKGKENENAKGA